MSVTSWRRRVALLWWRLLNPVTRPFAGYAPWWVLVETTGRKTGRRRRTPLAAGPRDGAAMWVIAVHGNSSGWVRNLSARPAVRVKHRGRWYDGTAVVHAMDPAVVKRFNIYARQGPRTLGIEPMLVRVDLRVTDGTGRA